MPATKPKTPAKPKTKATPKGKTKAPLADATTTGKPRQKAATAEKPRRGRGPQTDLRKGNGGLRNPPTRQKKWQPTPAVREDRSTGTVRRETMEEAWSRYRTLVSHHVAAGTPMHMIGRMFQPEFSEKTLRKNFAREIDIASLGRHAEVQGHLMAGIRRGDGASIRFYLATQCGWRTDGGQGGNAPISIEFDPELDATL